MTKAVKYILSKYVGNTQNNVTYDVKHGGSKNWGLLECVQT